MNKFTIAYDGEIIPYHIFHSAEMAEDYLYRCGFEKINSEIWELRETTLTSRAKVVKINKEEKAPKVTI